MTLIRIEADSNDWDDIVCSMTGHNLYQRAAYHRLATRMDGGSARLFFFESGTRRVALPLLLRRVDAPVQPDGTALQDATSVYGYPGILSNADDLPQEFIDRFQFVFQTEMQRENVVTVFSRLGIFRSGINLIANLGVVEKIGDTVAIDLSVPDETRFQQYRRNHRTNIQQLRALGATTDVNNSDDFVLRFEEAYRHNMQRVGARSWFMFGVPYFRELCAQFPQEIVMLQTEIGGETACGGMFFCSGECVYAHLVATADTWVGRSPTKVLFDDAAKYFRQRGCRWLHLGGGVGASQDGLYQYKRGFSDITFPFQVWKYVVDPERYEQLCLDRQTQIDDDSCRCFFPQYRATAATH